MVKEFMIHSYYRSSSRGIIITIKVSQHLNFQLYNDNFLRESGGVFELLN